MNRAEKAKIIDGLKENLKAVDPPYLDTERKTRLQSLFGRIQRQVL